MGWQEGYNSGYKDGYDAGHYNGHTSARREARYDIGMALAKLEDAVNQEDVWPTIHSVVAKLRAYLEA